MLTAAVTCGTQPTTTPAPAPTPTTTPTPAPTPQGPTNPVVEVASHGAHNCVRRQAGDVLCWGKNTYGQLGDGTRETQGRAVKVTGLADATQVVTGLDYSCALRKGGSVVCWGNNQDGQLGDGRGAKIGALSGKPTKVAGLGTVAQLSSGDWHVCARETSGAVKCWGNGENGQIGSDTKRAFPTPLGIEQLGPAKQIASGANHVCALQNDGRVKCWGRNTEGQLGDGKSGSKIKPVFVSNLEGVTGVWSGHTFSCASLENGAVKCWGDNKKGQLGPSAGRDPKWNAPIPFADLKDVAELVGGESHGCIRQRTGRVSCWGSNEGGRAVGKGTGVVAKPSPVRGVSDAVSVAAGLSHTCAVRKGGDVVCWGSPADQALGPYRLARLVLPG